MNRVIVSVVIGLILAGGVYFSVFLERGTGEAGTDVPPATELEVVPVPTVVERAGQRINLYPEADQHAIIVRERQAELANNGNRQVVPIVPVQPAASATAAPVVATSIPTQVPLPTTPPTIAPVQAVSGNCGQLVTRQHTVAAGDTLYRLTEMYTTSLEQLAAYGINDGLMVVGNVINVPSTGCVCNSDRSHVVQPGQNVFRLAIQHGTTKETLQQLNGLNADYLILVGQRLCLP
ncbi:MAG: LysM peptidoglycan-binding domain-containing protein [Candidatus Promineifilaceae bacterium]